MTKIYEVPAEVAARALIDKDGYDSLYRRSVDDNEGYWAEQAGRIDWIQPFTKVKDVSFNRDDLHIRWYYDGTLNACYNLSLIHISEPTRLNSTSRMPSSA